MTKLIYFDEKNDLTKSFCGESGQFVSKVDFSTRPEKYLDCIAVCYGLSNYGEILTAKANKINFIYIDNAYFGTLNSYHTKKKPKKVFYRIVANDLVLHKIVPRSEDRLMFQHKYLEKNYGYGKLLNDVKNDGYNIIIVPPSGKVLQNCEIDKDKWVQEIFEILKPQTDLNITVKERARSRNDRFVSSSIYDYLQDGYAIITFASMAAVEAISYGVRSFIYNNKIDMYPSAAKPVSMLNIKNINNKYFPDLELRTQWLSSLAYGQFSREEISNLYARNFILESMQCE